MSSHVAGSKDRGFIHTKSRLATRHVYMGQQAVGVDSPVLKRGEQEDLCPRLEQGDMS